jgi:glucokinase
MESYVLGIDLGGTKVSAVVADQTGNIVGRGRAKTGCSRGTEPVFETIVKVGRGAIEASNIDSKKIVALGIGSPGPLDPDSGHIIHSANLPFENFPLGPRLADAFGCPVALGNDVGVGTYGEYKAGAGRGAHSLMGLFVGTGIGGGLIINGELYCGFNKNAGELGHVVIKAGGPKCKCGSRGCLESLASRTAMTRQIRKAIRNGRKTRMRKAVDKYADRIPSGAFKNAYEDGDKVVTRIVHTAADYVGIGIGSLVNAFSPEVIVLGGGVIEALGDAMLPRIELAARKTAFEYSMKDVRIVKAELGDDAGVIGAAILAREKFGRPLAEVSGAAH